MGGVERVGGAKHVRSPELFAALEPKRNIGGGVDHELATGRMFLPCARLGDVARDHLARWICDQVATNHLVAVG